MNLSGTSHDLEFKEVVDEKVVEARQRDLVLFNDDVNTFDFVIEALIEVCNHDSLQAEQCTYIVHYNGKCVVKSGSYSDLNPMREALCDRGLSAVIK
ncbi:MAG TPA: ATP-dependent Clp protease adaptor ClpS [Bacteroidia bacterium]|nr:ATP-dependent Clp protease adaptor ClpS [Bacteroidia bacterium]HNQ00291.1 ATP-dependent Clp protease adaptor ClpS [Bacteroidia bacterium]